MKRVLPIAILLTTIVTCQAREIAIPLKYVDGEGAIFNGLTAVLHAHVPMADDDGFIAIEAEWADRHQFDPDMRHKSAAMPEDEGASQGEYLDRAVYATYEFIANEAGDYWLWARVRTGEGQWRFRDVVNGTVWWFFDEGGRDEAPENPDEWHWMPRRKVTLREGYNRLTITDYGYEFPQIDRLVFAPTEEWTPEGLGPDPSFLQIGQGWVGTAPVDPPGVERLVRVEGLGPWASGAQYRVGDGDYIDLEVVDGAAVLDMPAPDQHIRFQVTLSREQQDSGGPLELIAEVDDDAAIVEQDGGLAWFDGQTGDLFALLRRTDEGLVSVATPEAAGPLFSIDFKLPGERRKVRVDPVSVTEIVAEHDERRGWLWKEQEPREVITDPRSVEVTEDGWAATWLLSAEGMGRAEVSIEITRRDWDITVRHLEGPADVVAVDFPRLRGVTIGHSGLDDRQFRMQSFGHEVVNPGSGPLRDAAYCGQVVMPWQEVYDEGAGFYVGAHDPEAYNVEFVSEAGGLAAETFSFSPRKLDDIKPGEERTYPYVVALHDGQWHAGADIYREWFNETFGQADYPEFMRSMDGWINLQAENMRKQFRFAQLPDYFTQARAIGLDWVQVWGQFAYDGGPCCHDLPVLSPMYGGSEGWEAACREILSRGGYVGGYFIYDRIDQIPIATDWYLGHFRKSEYPDDTPWPTSGLMSDLMAVTDPGGELPPWPPSEEQIAEWQELIGAHQEVYAAGDRARAVTDWRDIWCNDDQWRAYLREWIADRYAGQWAANACYIDVLGCGSTMESYDPRRGHNGEGTWGMGKLAIAREVTEAARDVFPDYAPSMEGMGDLPGLYMASMCSGVYRGGRNVMRYTFPDRLFIHGLANSRSGGEHIDRYAETFLEGMRYDFVGIPNADGVRWLNLHRSFTPWLYDARFMDTRGIRTWDARVKVRRFALPDGAPDGMLLTVVNRERLADVEVWIEPEQAAGISRGFFVTMDGEVEALALKPEGANLAFIVPDAVASQIILVRDAVPESALWPTMRLVRYPNPAVEVTLLNLSGEVQSGTCSLANLGFPEPREDEMQAALASLPLAETEAQFEVVAGEVETLRFPIESLRHHQYSVRLQATIAREGAPEITREFLALPLMLDGSFEALGTTSDVATHGDRVLELGPSMEGYQYAPQRLWVEPGRKYRLEVRSRRTGFDARVHSTALQVHGVSESGPIERAPIGDQQPNEWRTLEYEFETPEDLSRATLYLYNVESPNTAYFDDVYVEDLGPTG